VPRGKPFTAEQIETASEVWHRTGSYTEAAKAIGADVSATRKALLRHGEPERAKLHALACARGLRRGRRHLTAAGDLIARVLLTETNAGVGLEPKDIAALTNSLARMSDSLIAIADREDRRRAAALSRRKTRAEIDALERSDTDEGGDIDLVVEVEADGQASVAADPQAD
jgi:hypothetical protein